MPNGYRNPICKKCGATLKRGNIDVNKWICHNCNMIYNFYNVKWPQKNKLKLCRWKMKNEKPKIKVKITCYTPKGKAKKSAESFGLKYFSVIQKPIEKKIISDREFYYIYEYKDQKAVYKLMNKKIPNAEQKIRQFYVTIIHLIERGNKLGKKGAWKVEKVRRWIYKQLKKKVKNPKEYAGVTTFTGSTYSGLYALKLDAAYTGTPTVGETVTQTQSATNIAKGYVASYDSTTKVLKYFKDRSLFLTNGVNQEDRTTIGVDSKVVEFNNSDSITFTTATSTTVSAGFTGSSENGINLGITFAGGLSNPEINKKTGDIIYIDNRPEVERNLRQKEDVKIILEF